MAAPPPSRALQAEVVAAMKDPSFYGIDEPVDHRETHISHVFLIRDRAYKLKKELRLPFVNYGTLERRRSFCDEEIRLNRPLAPSVYLGVRSVVQSRRGFELAGEADPRAVEYVVEMRRFSDDDTLGARVRDGRADHRLMRGLAEVIAALHAEADPVPSGRRGGGLGARVGSDLDQLQRASVDAPDAADLSIVARGARAFLDRHRDELDARTARGLVREGHGDLRLEHVLVGDRIELVDCVEFDPELRRADVAYDLAFTVMELHDAGTPALADELITAYRSAGGDPGDGALLHGLAACRALVRAKVAALRTEPRPGELAHFLGLTRRLLWLARCPITVVVCGPSASGKTTLAAEMARASGLLHFNSDVVRKQLAGVAPKARLGPSGYSAAASRATYAELGRLAAQQAARGEGAFVDATFRRAADRGVFDEALRGAPGPFVVLALQVSPDIARARAALRATDPLRVSDAGPERAAAQVQEFEPIEAPWANRAVYLDADCPLTELTAAAETAVDARLA